MQTHLIEAARSFQEAQILTTISSIQFNLKKEDIPYLHGKYLVRNYFYFLTKDSYSVLSVQ